MRRLIQLVPILATAALLLGLTSYNYATHVSASNADAYHQRIRVAAAGIPQRIGKWNGVDEEVPWEAIQLLHPNVLFDRRYSQASTNESASLLLIQCRDIRDMLGHYPPICYPAHGCTLDKQFAVALPIAGMTVPGVEYEFSSVDPGNGVQHMAVINFLVLPDGKFIPDMDALRRVAGFRRRQPFGAAQVQLVCDGQMPPEERLQIFKQLIPALVPTLDVIRRGDVP